MASSNSFKAVLVDGSNFEVESGVGIVSKQSTGSRQAGQSLWSAKLPSLKHCRYWILPEIKSYFQKLYFLKANIMISPISLTCPVVMHSYSAAFPTGTGWLSLCENPLIEGRSMQWDTKHKGHVMSSSAAKDPSCGHCNWKAVEDSTPNFPSALQGYSAY